MFRESIYILINIISSVKQKYVYGIDWKAEQEDFRKLAFVDGGADIESLENGIYLSEPVAHNLNARINDDILSDNEGYVTLELNVTEAALGE